MAGYETPDTVGYANQPKRKKSQVGYRVQNKPLRPGKRLKHGGYPKLHSHAILS
jgi:hypothetical protein